MTKPALTSNSISRASIHIDAGMIHFTAAEFPDSQTTLGGIPSTRPLGTVTFSMSLAAAALMAERLTVAVERFPVATSRGGRPRKAAVDAASSPRVLP